MIDEDRVAAHAFESAVVAERHRAQVVVVADAGEDDRRASVAASRGVAAAWPPYSATQACDLAMAFG